MYANREAVCGRQVKHVKFLQSWSLGEEVDVNRTFTLPTPMKPKRHSDRRHSFSAVASDSRLFPTQRGDGSGGESTRKGAEPNEIIDQQSSA
jgi:hypothetical protein